MNFEEYKKAHNKFNENLNTAPMFYFLKLMEEVGEVAEITAALNGSTRKLAKLGGKEKLRDKLIEELGDVVCVALTCAFTHGIEPEELFEANAAKLEERLAAKNQEKTLPSREYIHSVMAARNEQIKSGTKDRDGNSKTYLPGDNWRS